MLSNKNLRSTTKRTNINRKKKIARRFHASPLWFAVQVIVFGLLVFVAAASIGITAENFTGSNSAAPFGIEDPGYFWEEPVYLRLLVNSVLPTAFTGAEESGLIADTAHTANLALGISTGILAGDPITILGDRLYEFQARATKDGCLISETKWDNFNPGDVFLPTPGSPEDVQIIIYHTHTTESFIPTSGVTFSEDLNVTVAALGEYLKRILEQEYGIKTLHNKKIHDLPRSSAYRKALPTLQGLLADNPSVQIVIDLHRDGVSRDNTTAEVDGRDVGTLMFVIGKNHSASDVNESFAKRLDYYLKQTNSAISRGLHYSEKYSYNQEFHPRSVIVEVGGHENSLEEVKTSIPYLAEAIAGVYEELQKKVQP